MVEEVLNIARYDANVIIQGETGSGKERVFDLIQQNSLRREKPAIKINCATIQENLAESEFFGYEKGSFTGASAEGKDGYFALANNGTLFLDEIGSLPLDMQAKLLRVLQENTFYRIGGTEPIHVNVRVIVANNVPLKKLVEEGKFREDLYYRLNICQINVPPLRARKEDIVCLADAFLKNYGEKYGLPKSFSPDAYKELMEYHWPGNVRELENTVHRLYITERGDVIDGADVSSMLNESVFDDVVVDVRKEFSRDKDLTFDSIMDQQEERLIAFALKKEGTTRAAAEFLGMPQATLARKKIKHGL
ncbi:MAG: sigma 54-interacting transcriptional regulator [Firmicutes bacterium]|nr:sigma 54-interacting transcriptional regulator [Bacillota bacterium]